MPSSSKKILVTGVAGFLGSHLSEKLVELGHKVGGIDNMLGGCIDVFRIISARLWRIFFLTSL